MKNHQASQRRLCERQAASFFKVEADQITQYNSRSKIEKEKQIKREQNAKKLKEYIIELRRTYDGEVLAYIEENVFKAWERRHFSRTAELAHYDGERAINKMKLENYICELRSKYSGEVLSYLESHLIQKWEMNNYLRPIDQAREDVDNAIEVFSKATL